LKMCCPWVALQVLGRLHNNYCTSLSVVELMPACHGGVIAISVSEKSLAANCYTALALWHNMSQLVVQNQHLLLDLLMAFRLPQLKGHMHASPSSSCVRCNVVTCLCQPQTYRMFRLGDAATLHLVFNDGIHGLQTHLQRCPTGEAI
jgi:hypothetical protein